jgi:hypothetical protein
MVDENVPAVLMKAQRARTDDRDQWTRPAARGNGGANENDDASHQRIDVHVTPLNSSV